MTYTIKAKIKQNKTLASWFLGTSKLAANLYNACLNSQFDRASRGEKLYSTIDFINIHRSFTLGSDYKDRVIERAVKSTTSWYESEPLRYEIYWKNLEKHLEKPEVSKEFKASHFPFFLKTEHEKCRQSEYRSFVKNLSRIQKIVGKPRVQKTISIAFSIRKDRQNTVKFGEKTVEVTIPKFKPIIKGCHNRLPFASDFSLVQGILKKDNCGDLWLCVVVDGTRPRPKIGEETEKETVIKSPLEKIVVGIDLGLKSARTVVAVDEKTRGIVEIYQPDRTNFFNLGYDALVQGSSHDKRALPFVHRKIARRRHDCIEKEVCKILDMGDVFKIGKPSTAWLLSGRLARSAADVANSKFLTRLAKRAKEAGKEAGEINESYTSQTCRICGNRKKMPLAERIYECDKSGCNHVENRDVNAAFQIAFRDFDEKKRTKAPKKMKNGVLPRRGMKALIGQDFQAKPPCKPPDLSGGGAAQV